MSEVNNDTVLEGVVFQQRSKILLTLTPLFLSWTPMSSYKGTFQCLHMIQFPREFLSFKLK